MVRINSASWPHYFLLYISFFLAASLGCTSAEAQILEITQFERLDIAGQERPPTAANHNWQPVILKDVWTVEKRKQHLETWYRTTFTLNNSSSGPWSIFVPRHNSVASFWLNGVEVGNTGPFSPPLPMNFNRPALISFPGSHLQQGENQLYIRVLADKARVGALYEITVGSTRELEPIHARSYFAKVTATQLLTITMFIIVLALSVICLKSKQPISYHWFLIASLCWAIYSVNLYIQYVPVDLRWWQLMFNIALIGSVCCYTLAFHRMLKIRSKVYEYLIIALMVLCVISFIYREPVYFTRTNTFMWFAVMLLITYLGSHLMWRGWTGRRHQQLWMVWAGAPLIVLAWYDISVIFLQITVSFAKYPYIPLVALVCGGVAFTRRYIQTGQEIQTLKIAADKKQQMAAKDAVVAERSRLMREIHDGVGGQLVSALSMLENTAHANTPLAQSLKTSLEELRLIINSLESVGQEGNVVSLLASLRDRLELQLQAKSVRLDWAVQELPPLENFGSDQSLQVMRIVQEAITNVIKHSNAHWVKVECQAMTKSMLYPDSEDTSSGIAIIITNDGIPEIPRHKQAGIGLDNMAHRARTLGGHFEFERDKATAQVKLWIPLNSQQRQSSRNDTALANS